MSKPILKGLFLAIAYLSVLNFAPAILSDRMADLDIHENLFGVVFAFPCIVSAWAIYITIKLMEKFNADITIFIGTIIMCAGFFVSVIETVEWFLIGIAILAIWAPLVVLPIFPLMANSISNKEENAELIKTNLSGLYNASLGVGSIFGPVIGSYLYFYFGFSVTVFCLGITGVALLIVLILTGSLNLSQNKSKIEISLKTIPIHMPSYHDPSWLGSEYQETPRASKRISPKVRWN